MTPSMIDWPPWLAVAALIGAIGKGNATFIHLFDERLHEGENTPLVTVRLASL